ncbi:hypothetical protein MINT15_23340 [Saccharomonospora viridis]|uniref:Uncharacterized protein n=1 Tax=Saccharomonospora viridis TaxID=1852 RepID=A0A837D853_9PSEU|nr:hypothetical protein MINT15_23340 [Saccharomonospora viridis]
MAEAVDTAEGGPLKTRLDVRASAEGHRPRPARCPTDSAL